MRNLRLIPTSMRRAGSLAAILAVGLAVAVGLRSRESRAQVERARPVTPPVPPAACSPRVCAPSIVVKKKTVALYPGDGANLNNQVVCDPGYRATGGGFAAEDTRNTNLWESQPSDNDNAWVIGATNRSNVPESITYYVVCLLSD
jgi:hypothetical protein